MRTDLFKFQIKLQVMISQTVARMKRGTDSRSNITHLRVSATLEGNVAQCCISLPFDTAVPVLTSLFSGRKTEELRRVFIRSLHFKMNPSSFKKGSD